MNLERWFRRIILLNVIVALGAFGVSEESFAVMLFVELLAGVGWWITEVQARKNGWPGIPRWVVSIVLTIMLCVALLRAWVNSDLVVAFAEFLASILVLKLWERREIRDYAQLLTLSLFMSVAATLSQTSILVAAVWLFQIPLLTAGVMLFQIYAAAERAKASQTQSPTQSLSQTDAQSTTPAGARAHLPAFPFLRTCTGVLAVGIAISSAIFVVIPRGYGIEQWGGTRKMRTQGFTENVEPGAGDLVSQSEAQVLEVRFRDKSGDIIGGNGETFYLRGAVLENYFNTGSGSWKSHTDGPVSEVLRGGQNYALTSDAGDPGWIVQDVTLIPAASGYTPVFAIYRPISVSFDPGSGEHRVDIFHDTGHISTTTNGSQTSYRVISTPDAPSTNPGPRRQVDFPSAPIHDRAVTILRGAGIDPDPATRPRADDERAAAAFEDFLRSTYSYSTDRITAPVKGNSTEWFLFENTARSGHCEYFASALAAMSRSVGVDARVIAGYLVDEFDPSRSIFIVRASHAHAWVEIDSGPNGWKTFDATPATVRRQENRDSIRMYFRRLFESLDNIWTSNIVSFDQYQQERLLSRVGQVPVSDWALDWQKQLRRAWNRFKRTASPWAIAGWSSVVLISAGSAWLLVRHMRRRRKARRTDGWAMRSPERRVYNALLTHLRKHGHPKPSWLPPLAHLDMVAVTNPSLADQARGIVHLIYAARFGDGGAAALAQARNRLAHLHAR